MKRERSYYLLGRTFLKLNKMSHPFSKELEPRKSIEKKWVLSLAVAAVGDIGSFDGSLMFAFGDSGFIGISCWSQGRAKKQPKLIKRLEEYALSLGGKHSATRERHSCKFFSGIRKISNATRHQRQIIETNQQLACNWRTIQCISTRYPYWETATSFSWRQQTTSISAPFREYSSSSTAMSIPQSRNLCIPDERHECNTINALTICAHILATEETAENFPNKMLQQNSICNAEAASLWRSLWRNF